MFHPSPNRRDLRVLAQIMAMSISLCITLAGLVQPATAHEVQPAIADLRVIDGQVRLDIEMTLEAPVAGLNLQGVEDTDDTAQSDSYDRLRALSPASLKAALQQAWPDFRDMITIEAGDTRLTPEISGADIPDIGDVELPRLSTLRLTAPLPEDATTLVIGWAPELGALVVRQQLDGTDEGYSAYLTDGQQTDPIPIAEALTLPTWRVFLDYVGIGFDHIIPKGLDHILFVLGLFFLSLKLKPLLWQVTAFTLAHTVTLALGILGFVTVPATIVEPLIAASIVYVGVENVLSRGLTPWRPVVVFYFGLLHGLGFASVLGNIGLNPAQFVTGLIGFNVGVELGQLAVIALAFLAVGLWFRRAPWYKTRIANPASILIALVGAWWVVERTLL